MQCATGTQCAPSGLSYDFRVQDVSDDTTATSGAVSTGVSRTSIARVNQGTVTFALVTVLIAGNWWVLTIAGIIIAAVLP